MGIRRKGLWVGKRVRVNGWNKGVGLQVGKKGEGFMIGNKREG